MQPTGTSRANSTHDFHTPTTDKSLPKPPIDTSSAKSQDQSPLFGVIPGEIRNRIFDLALTAYPGKQEPFEKSVYYCRPGFRYADMKIDTALLRTCRRAYGEARLVPRENYEHVEWRVREHWPSEQDARRYRRRTKPGFWARIYPWVTSLHLFPDQYELENQGWRNFLQSPLWKLKLWTTLQDLKLTIRHCDWHPFWLEEGPLALDAKQKDMALPKKYRQATDEFEIDSWGSQFELFHALKRFELELETVEQRRKELDDIVVRAADWRFPLKHGKELVLNPAKTKKTGWHGVRNRKCISPRTPATLPRKGKIDRDLTSPAATAETEESFNIPNDPIEAKANLIKDGIDFIAWDGEPEVLDENCLTYYVVSLIYEAQPV